MRIIRILIFMTFAAAFAHAQSSYLIDKNTGERFGPFSFAPQTEVKIRDTVFTVAPVQEDLVFKTPEDALRAYLQCEHWEDRIPLVVDGDRVSKLMRSHYRNFQAPRYFKINPRKQQPTGSTHPVLLTANVSGIDSQYVIRRTGTGYKIDWEKSQAQWQRKKSDATAEQFKLDNAVLHVKVVRLEQRASSTYLHIRIKNSSQAFLAYWSVGATLHTRDEEYLGHAYANGNNLRPGADVYDKIIFSDVLAPAPTWKLQIEGMTIEDSKGNRLSDGEKYFTLTEVK